MTGAAARRPGVVSLGRSGLGEAVLWWVLRCVTVGGEVAVLWCVIWCVLWCAVGTDGVWVWAPGVVPEGWVDVRWTDVARR